MPSARRSSRPRLSAIESLQPSLFPELVAPPRIHHAIRLTEANVARTVRPAVAGVYFLKIVLPRGGIHERVGRDDYDVRTALLALAAMATENELFGWAEARDGAEAFQFECLLWHAKGGSWKRLTTQTHPEPPAEYPWLRCPECGGCG